MITKALDFISAAPARIASLFYGLLITVALVATVSCVALWYRGQAIKAEGERDLAIAQGNVLAAGIEACNAGVDRAEKAAVLAIDSTRMMLEEARRLHASGASVVKRIEGIMNQPPPTRADGRPAGCDEAWDAIQQNARAP